MNFKRMLPLMFVFFLATAAFAAELPYMTVSIEEIEKSLPNKPIAIGLDVDDTAMFSSPGFYYAFNNTDGKNKTNKYGDKPLSNQQFWEDLSCEFDKFSMHKESAARLIEMHNKRGDKIFFITARPQPQGKEILTECLHRAFKLKNQPKAIFTGYVTKAKFIKENGISIYYGDSDSDITEAWDAGIRAIRFLRSPLSTNKGKYNPGKFGEFVLENSLD